MIHATLSIKSKSTQPNRLTLLLRVIILLHIFRRLLQKYLIKYAGNAELRFQQLVSVRKLQAIEISYDFARGILIIVRMYKFRTFVAIFCIFFMFFKNSARKNMINFCLLYKIGFSIIYLKKSTIKENV